MLSIPAVVLAQAKLSISSSGAALFEYTVEMAQHLSTEKFHFERGVEELSEEDEDLDWDYLSEQNIKYSVTNFEFLFNAVFISFHSFYEFELKKMALVMQDQEGSPPIPTKKPRQPETLRYIEYLEKWFIVDRGRDFEILEDFRKLRNRLIHHGSEIGPEKDIVEKYNVHVATNTQFGTLYFVDARVFDLYYKAIQGFFRGMSPITIACDSAPLGKD